MKRSVHMARLGIALISFANATAALTAPKALAFIAASAPLTIHASLPGTSEVRVQRPPRVPRRERFESAMAEVAAGTDA